jgi:lipopolysaccharide/colanic/teichoic acid biosynthesis glycosyltransferase
VTTPPGPAVDGKRIFDVAASVVALAVLLPVLFVLAVAVRLDSRGPVLFRQERVGLRGRRFRIHKFRSMRVDQGGPLVSRAGDPRVTRVGAVLRRTKLDELPQLVDVLVGRMSIVGPRPELPQYVALWTSAQREVILSVRPGITDPASIMLRDEGDQLARVDDPERHYVDVLLPAKAAMYVDYVAARTLLGDLRIILRTVRAVIRR